MVTANTESNGTKHNEKGIKRNKAKKRKRNGNKFHVLEIIKLLKFFLKFHVRYPAYIHELWEGIIHVCTQAMLEIKISHVHRYHNFQFQETDQCRLLCIWVITQRSFVTTQITATQTLLNKNKGWRVQIVNTSERLPAKICNDKHSSKADLTT